MPWLETSSMTERKRFIDDTHRAIAHDLRRSDSTRCNPPRSAEH